MDVRKKFEASLRKDLLSFRKAREEWLSKKIKETASAEEVSADRSTLAALALDLTNRLDWLGYLGAAVIVSPSLAVTAWPRTGEDDPEQFIEFFEWNCLCGWDEEIPVSGEDQTVPFLKSL